MASMSNRLVYKKENIVLMIIKFILFFASMGVLYVGYLTDQNLQIYNYINIVILITLCFIELRITKKIYSPLLIWYVFWFGAVIISRISIDFYNLRYTWGDQLFFYVIVNTIIFFLVFHLTYFIKSFFFSGKKRIFQNNNKLNPDKLYNFTISILIVGIISFLINAILLRNIPMFSSNPNYYRSTFVTTKFFLIVNLARVAVVFVPIVLNSTLNKVKKKQLMIVSIIYALLNLATGWRGYFFQILILYITSHFGTAIYNNKAKKQLIKYGFIAILSIGLIGLLREGVMIKSYGLVGFIEYTVRIIYLYIAPNFLNFQQTLNSLEPNYNFVYTTEMIWGFFLSKDFFSTYENLSFSIGGFNVSTYLMHPYADFGFIGTIIWTSIISYVSASNFYKYTKTGSIKYLTIVGIFNIVIFTMHSNFFLRSSSILVWILISYVAYRYSYGVNKSNYRYELY